MPNIPDHLRPLISLLEKVPEVGKIYGIKDNEYEEIINLLLTSNQWEGDNSFDNPIVLNYLVPSVTGLAGSGNVIKNGFSFSQITNSDPNYPDIRGVVATFKFSNFRCFQFFVSHVDSSVYIRILHETEDHVWINLSDSVKSVSGVDVNNTDPSNPIVLRPTLAQLGAQPAGSYMTTNTDQSISVVKSYSKPQRIAVTAPEADGSSGSANAWLVGFSYSEVAGGIAKGYPEDIGIVQTLKISNSRTIQIFQSATSAKLYSRRLHSSASSSWVKYVEEAPSNDGYYARRNEAWEVAPTGGDVTQAGNNAFTGSNSFVLPPTSGEDAISPNELVRFGQVIKQSISDYSPDIVASSSNPSVTTTSTSGWYCRTGSMITVYADIAWSAFSGGSGIVQVTLPTLIGTEVYGEKSVGTCRLSGFTYPSSGTQISTELNFDNTRLNIVSNSSGGSFENVEVSDVIAGSGRIQLEIQLLIIEAA